MRVAVDEGSINHLTLRFLMGALADNATEVPLLARPYQLAVLKGRENEVAPLRVALDRLKATGEFDRIVEQHRVEPITPEAGQDPQPGGRADGAAVP